jgi:hypothetical protein
MPAGQRTRTQEITMQALVDLDLRTTCMGQRYGRDPITLHMCGDCGALVADQLVHNAWHNRKSSVWQAAGSPPLAFELGIPAETQRVQSPALHCRPGASRSSTRPASVVRGIHRAPRLRTEQGVGQQVRLGRPEGHRSGDDLHAVGNIPMADRLPAGNTTTAALTAHNRPPIIAASPPASIHR